MPCRRDGSLCRLRLRFEFGKLAHRDFLLKPWTNNSLFTAEVRQFGLRSCQGFAVFLCLLVKKLKFAGGSVHGQMFFEIQAS